MWPFGSILGSHLWTVRGWPKAWPRLHCEKTQTMFQGKTPKMEAHLNKLSVFLIALARVNSSVYVCQVRLLVEKYEEWALERRASGQEDDLFAKYAWVPLLPLPTFLKPRSHLSWAYLSCPCFSGHPKLPFGVCWRHGASSKQARINPTNSASLHRWRHCPHLSTWVMFGSVQVRTALIFGGYQYSIIYRQSHQLQVDHVNHHWQLQLVEQIWAVHAKLDCSLKGKIPSVPAMGRWRWHSELTHWYRWNVLRVSWFRTFEWHQVLQLRLGDQILGKQSTTVHEIFNQRWLEKRSGRRRYVFSACY